MQVLSHIASIPCHSTVLGQQTIFSERKIFSQRTIVSRRKDLFFMSALEAKGLPECNAERPAVASNNPSLSGQPETLDKDS